MSDKLELLRIFERTARLGSFTLAAESLGLSRPNVSRAIRRLEEETGRRLLHRTTRVVTLTNEGETFLAEARRLLALSDRLFAPPKENGESPLEGTLRIASSVSFAAFFLAGALEDFLSLHPGLCAELLTGEQNLTASRLAASRIDLGFSVSNAVPERVAVRELAATTGVLCASPACVEREGMPETPEALLTKSVVTSRYPDACASFTGKTEEPSSSRPRRDCATPARSSFCKAFSGARVLRFFPPSPCADASLRVRSFGCFRNGTGRRPSFGRSAPTIPHPPPRQDAFSPSCRSGSPRTTRGRLSDGFERKKGHLSRVFPTRYPFGNQGKSSSSETKTERRFPLHRTPLPATFSMLSE